MVIATATGLLTLIPIRALVAHAVRCARRVQPLLPAYSHAGVCGDAIEASLSLGEEFAAGIDLDPARASQVEEALRRSLRVVSGDETSDHRLTLVLNAAYAVLDSVQAALMASDEEASPVAAEKVVRSAKVAFDAATAVDERVRAAAGFDWDRLEQMDLGEFPELGKPLNATESGVLGPLFQEPQREQQQDPGSTLNAQQDVHEPCSTHHPKSESQDSMRKVPVPDCENRRVGSSFKAATALKTQEIVQKLRAKQERLESDQAALRQNFEQLQQMRTQLDQERAQLETERSRLKSQSDKFSKERDELERARQQHQSSQIELLKQRAVMESAIANGQVADQPYQAATDQPTPQQTSPPQPAPQEISPLQETSPPPPSPPENMNQPVAETRSVPGSAGAPAWNGATAGQSLRLIVEPGNASPTEISELLHEISELYRCLDGGGVRFSVTDCKSWEVPQDRRLYDSEASPERMFVELHATPCQRQDLADGDSESQRWDRFVSCLDRYFQVDTRLIDFFELGNTVPHDHRTRWLMKEASELAFASTTNPCRQSQNGNSAGLPIDAMYQQLARIEGLQTRLERELGLVVELAPPAAPPAQEMPSGRRRVLDDSFDRPIGRSPWLKGLLASVIIAIIVVLARWWDPIYRSVEYWARQNGL